MPILHPELSRLVLDGYFATLSRCDLTRRAQTRESLVEVLSSELIALDVAIRQNVAVSYNGVFGMNGHGQIDLLAAETVAIHVLSGPAIQATEIKLLAAHLLAGNYPLGVALNFGAPEHQFVWQRRPVERA
jgi:hypothetical protein